MNRDVALRLFVFCTLLWAGVSAAPTEAVAQDDTWSFRPSLDYRRGAPVRRARGTVPAHLRNPAAASYDVVALRVEFQPDTTRFTTGDGTFDGELFGDLQPRIDPLPHDAGYFEAHLAFLEDYVSRVSDGRTVVQTHLIPEVVRLPDRMGAYAPTGPNSNSDAERARLARLVEEAWALAEARSNFDMSRFTPGRTAFVLFHAGVGRDVELIGTVLDKTPEDLPSIFLGAETLDRLGAGGITFNGFPVDHSMLVPRTESRLGMDFIADEPFLLELSINGMLAASFFNYLGVPDLFDVESGRSAIGPFGLMDPQGIFAYAGLFPPEPTAWTKYYLGWTDPLELTGDGPVSVELAAASIPGASPSARVSISDAEYFLVENRYRDPEHDGLTLRVYQDGVITEQYVENGDPEFNSIVVDAFIGGVVVGVDNYDWALPGGLDDQDNELNGGILVWHVDERRLLDGLAENAVNVSDRRAVDLEEADGAQDIGHPSGNPFGAQPDLGTPFDFFYEGNPVVVETSAGREIRLYENRFGPYTFPSSQTNAGGPSFVVLEDFSVPGPEMSVTYRRETVAGMAALEDPALYALGAEAGALGPRSKLYASGEYYLLYDGAMVSAARSGRAERLGTAPSDAVPALIGGERLATLDREGGSYRLVVRALEDGLPPAFAFELPGAVTDLTPVSPVVYTNVERAEAYHLLLRGVVDGTERTVHVQVSAGEASIVSHADEPVGLATWEDPALGIVPVVFLTSGVSFGGTSWSFDLDHSDPTGSPIVGREARGPVAAFSEPEQGRLYVLGSDGSVESIDVHAAASRTGGEETHISEHPVLADLDADGHLDVVVGVGRQLFGFTQSGAVVAGFPLDVPARAVGQPLVVQFAGDTGWSLLAAASDGYVYGFGPTGRRLDGFPLEIGAGPPATPVVHDGRLLGASAGAAVKGWSLRPVEQTWWGGLYRDGGNGSFVALDGGPFHDSLPPSWLMDPRETYNWPNPVDEGVTHLRTATSLSARVKITIVDGAGGRVAELDMGTVRPGVPTEIVWEADVQSGLYFARFTATTEHGERETKVIKMAVIR